MHSAFTRAALVATLLGTALPAAADRGERALGLELGGGYPAAGRATLQLQEGLSDWVAGRVEIGAHLAELDENVYPEVLAAFGFAIAFDVFAWVPELYVGGGGAFGENGVRGRIIASGGVRTYVAMDWSLSFSVIGEWIPVEEAAVLGAIGIWWHFDDGS